MIDSSLLPLIERHALVGEARVSIPREASVFNRPLAMAMAVDVMFDRGFALRVEERHHEYRLIITRPPLPLMSSSPTHELLLSHS